MTRSLPLTLDTSSAVTPVTSSSRPATESVPESHPEDDLNQIQTQKTEDDQVINHHDHTGGDKTTEKPHTEHKHTKINTVLHNELLEELHKERHAAIQNHQQQRGHPRHHGMDDELLALYSSRKEITLGICAAFSVFLVVVLVFVVRVHKSRTLSGLMLSGVVGIGSAVDKETLIDNEADVGYLPPPPFGGYTDNESQTTVHV